MPTFEFSPNIAKRINKLLFDGLRKYPELWQLSLLSGRKLCDLARERDLGYWCLNDDMEKFWHLGLLSADEIQSNKRLAFTGLTPKRDGSRTIYFDNRDFHTDAGGMQGAFRHLDSFPERIDLAFHPFRFYVLSKIDKLFRLELSQSHFFNEKSYGKYAIKPFLEYKREFTSGPKVFQLFGRFNLITSLAVVCEPLALGRVIGKFRFPVFNRDGSKIEQPEAVFKANRDSFKALVAPMLKKIGVENLREIHRTLCMDAHDLDSNLDLHRVLRFATGENRLQKVKGRIGGAMYLLTMAEVIRLVAEDALEIQMPEEDGCGYYQVERSGKMRRFGAERLNDDKIAQKHFLRSFGLDREIRLNWYVEGETELAALEVLLANEPFIELFNLRGQILAGKGKGLAFQETLLSDIRSSVYSFVSIDGDVSDNVRILRRAAQEKKMYGMFFISTPDFEMQNFSALELVDIVCSVVDGGTVSQIERDRLAELCHDASTNADFFAAVRSVFPFASNIGKGKAWGAILADYIRKNVNGRSNDGLEFRRPIVDAIRLALNSLNTNYLLSLNSSSVDPETGQIVQDKT